MDTTEYTVSSSGYTLIAETNSKIQNKSSYFVRLICSTSTPSVDDENYYALAPGDFFLFKQDSSSDGDLYALCGSENQSSKVTVSSLAGDTPSDGGMVIVPYSEFLTINGDGVTTELSVDGSTTSVDAYIDARTDGAFYVTVLSVLIAGGNNTQLNRFADINNGLTNGIDFYYESTLGDHTIGVAKTNLDILRLAWITPGTGSASTAFEMSNLNVDNDNGYVFSMDLTKMSPTGRGILLRNSSADRIGVRVNDDLTSVSAFNVQAIGFVQLED